MSRKQKTVFVLAFWLLIGGFQWDMSRRIDRVAQRLQSVERRVDAAERRLLELRIHAAGGDS